MPWRSGVRYSSNEPFASHSFSMLRPITERELRIIGTGWKTGIVASVRAIVRTLRFSPLIIDDAPKHTRRPPPPHRRRAEPPAPPARGQQRPAPAKARPADRVHHDVERSVLARDAPDL